MIVNVTAESTEDTGQAFNTEARRHGDAQTFCVPGRTIATGNQKHKQP